MGLGLLVILFLPSKKVKENFPYYKKNGILTPAEIVFHLVLKEIINLNKYEIFSQVRLADIIKVKPGTEKILSYFYKISQKSPDFVICEKSTSAPLLIIELDDSSHKEKLRKKRDFFVDKALAAAELPVLHIPWNRNYNKEELTRKIMEKLK
jgi:hypothetical protein